VALANPIGVLTACALRAHRGHFAEGSAHPATGTTAYWGTWFGKASKAARAAARSCKRPSTSCRLPPWSNTLRQKSIVRSNDDSWRLALVSFRPHRPGHQRCQGSRSAPADALCRAAPRREFDIVMAWSVDRLSRSVTDLCNFLTEIHALKIDLYLNSQGLDPPHPDGQGHVSDRRSFCRARALDIEGAHHGRNRARP
jgi:Resolvase, N terminal domain